MARFPSEYLEGSRLLLRPPVLDDAEALFDGIAHDPEVTRYLLWTPHPDVGETRRVITEHFNVGDDERTWLLVPRDSGDIVGLISCRSRARHSVEIGYCLGRRWWGLGLMSEALGVLLAELAADPRVYRVWATCHVDNTRSARLLQRAGFVFEGRLRRHSVYPNLGPEPHDSLLYAKILR
ncbi:GNAT family N-acetyltransferase [Mycobacterium kansasii]|uniref:Acetyltransferase family protein n=3 Tax=Mycobacterium kansasii TaxID=1768 RepID=A0A1V3WGT9_MYCKA|nr:GNAT family N-acetyltransferase [Mycobacterium kansasii]EUA00278.1 acetyltransferase family protein [Mycobacterium kansasii 824]AGZ53466.1 GNAT family acetyltransferase [Mycobacterium kansasii ATCC 12478]ARG54935.1 GNAT family N-acetyltransferase [Mycobacterium kansasii]ARG60388.1 GNAT family N-acetyltransferase [Mycobacterium kansasii]ARG68067.1 GNAT family N-acetyltransferase [Mycobacterium kansasii]